MQLNFKNFFFIKNCENFFLFKFYNFILFFFFYKNYFINFKFFFKFKKKFSKFLFSYVSFYIFKYNLYKFFLSFFFLEFFLDGLYFRVKYYKSFNILGFILGFNHYLLYKLPSFIKACVHMKKRRFFLYSVNFNSLGCVGNEIVNLKYPNLFKGKGVKILFKNYRKKLILKKQK